MSAKKNRPSRKEAGSDFQKEFHLITTTLLLFAALTTLSPCASAQCCLPPPSGLVSWYSAEGDASDQTGANPGTLQTGTSFAAGEAGQAFMFDGVNGDVFIPASSTLDLGAGNGLTIECWIKPGDVSSPHALVEWNNGVGQAGMQLWTSVTPVYSGPGSLFVNFADTSGNSQILITGDNLLNTNTFQHVAVTYDKTSGVGTIYYNGTAVASASIGTLELQTTYDLYLGKRVSGGGTNPYLGLMDEVTFYNRALTASEIQAIFAAGSSGKCGTNSSVAPPVITAQPTNQSVYTGGTATFSVTATNCYLAYQWQFGISNIPGATNATLVLTDVQPDQAGFYSVFISNPGGSIISSNAQLTISTNCTSPPSGLVTWYQAEGDANDSVGGNHGTLTNGVSFATGEVGEAFYFDGTNGFITVPASTDLDLGAGGGMTLECWINPADVSSPHVIGEWNDALGHSGMQLWFSIPDLGGTGSFFVNFVETNGNSHFLTTPQNVVVTNAFQHVAVTYDKASGAGRIYYNGTLQASTTAPNLRLQTIYGFYLGKRVSAGAPSLYQGLLDEFCLYNRALTAAEIQNIYNVASAGKCVPLNPPTITGQPQNATVTPGGSAAFKVTATGTHSMTYQWLSNNIIFSGATNNSLILTNIQPNNSGDIYSAIVSNAFGVVTSSVAVLKVRMVTARGNNQLLTNSQYSFGNPVTITLSNFYPTGDIFYTLDGSTPTAGSTFYNGPFAVSQNSVLRTLGYSPDFSQSAVSDPITILIVPFYTLATTTAGGGKIAVSPTNNVQYASNTLVSLTAVPSNGWTFLQWLGDAAGSGTNNTVLMTRNKSVQALFGTTVGNTVGGNGSVRFNPLGGVYLYGTTLQASALPQPGNLFVVWGNAASGSTNPLSFIVTNANPVISALFTTLGGGQVALAVVPIGHGKVLVNPRANGYAVNSSVTITATPDAGKTFNGWSGDASGTQNPLTVIMTASKTIYANFSTNNSLSAHLTSGGLADGFQVDLNGEFGTHYRLDASSNLFDWVPLITGTNQEGLIHYIDTNATNFNRRYYRSVILP